MQFKTYLKTYFPWILCASALSILSYAAIATSEVMRVDSDLMQASPQVAMQAALSLGRFGFVALKYLLFLTTYDALRSGILFLFFFIVTTQLLCFLYAGLSEDVHDKKSLFSPPVFMLLFATSPVWAAQIYFIWQEAEIACALFMTALAAMLMFRAFCEKNKTKHILCFTVATLLLFFSIATYQTMVLFYLSIMTAGWLLLFARQMYERKVLYCHLRSIAFALAQSVLVTMIYFVVASLFFYDNASYHTGMIQWGAGPLRDNVTGIVRAIGKTMLCYEAFYVSAYPLCVVLTIVLLIKKNLLTKTATAALVFLMLTPFAMNVLLGAALPQRMQMALPLVAAFVPAFAVRLLSGKTMKRTMVAATAVFTLIQVTVCLLCYYTERVRVRRDAQYANTIIEALQLHNPENKPVILLGEHPLEPAFPLQMATEYAWSEFAQDASSKAEPDGNLDVRVYIKNETGVDVPAGFSKEDLRDACERAPEMPVFPDEGGILQTERYVLIKMSD